MNKLRGGKADGKPRSAFNPKDLAEGMREEAEHTDDPREREEIAEDHLVQDKRYYKKLKRVEKAHSVTRGDKSVTLPGITRRRTGPQGKTKVLPPPFPKPPPARKSEESQMDLVKSIIDGEISAAEALTGLKVGEQVQLLRELRKSRRQMGLFGGGTENIGVRGPKAEQTEMFGGGLFGGGGGGKKEGEGSRGGKVIGHTKSGKPIYDSPHHPAHAGFNASEQGEAEEHNRKIGWEPIPESKEGGWRKKGEKVGDGPKGPIHEYDYSYRGGKPKQAGLFDKGGPVAGDDPDPLRKKDLGTFHPATGMQGGAAPTGMRPGEAKPLASTPKASEAAAQKMGWGSTEKGGAPAHSFERIRSEIMSGPGKKPDDPDAVAAKVYRQKYGQATMTRRSAAARKNKAAHKSLQAVLAGEMTLRKAMEPLGALDQVDFLRELRKAKALPGQMGLFGGGGGEAPKPAAEVPKPAAAAPASAPSGKKGEGSRGGKVIGHTRTGKPIYDSAEHPKHANFTPEDHKDAAVYHGAKASAIIQAAMPKAKRLGRTTGGLTNSGVEAAMGPEKTAESNHHIKQANIHRRLAAGQPAEQPPVKHGKPKPFPGAKLPEVTSHREAGSGSGAFKQMHPDQHGDLAETHRHIAKVIGENHPLHARHQDAAAAHDKAEESARTGGGLGDSVAAQRKTALLLGEHSAGPHKHADAERWIRSARGEKPPEESPEAKKARLEKEDREAMHKVFGRPGKDPVAAGEAAGREHQQRAAEHRGAAKSRPGGPVAQAHVAAEVAHQQAADHYYAGHPEAAAMGDKAGHASRTAGHLESAYEHENGPGPITTERYNAADAHKEAAKAHAAARAARAAPEYASLAAVANDRSTVAGNADIRAKRSVDKVTHDNHASRHMDAMLKHRDLAKKTRNDAYRLRAKNPDSPKAKKLLAQADDHDRADRLHDIAMNNHSDASQRHAFGTYQASPKPADEAAEAASAKAHASSKDAWEASQKLGVEPGDVNKSMQPQGTKPKDPLMKDKTEKPKPSISDKRSPEERKKLAGRGPEPMEEEQPEPGTPEYHAQRALAHLAAAQAHANAHQSAKKLQETGDHDNIVQQAEQATQKVISKGGVHVHLGTDDEIVKYLEGAELGTVPTALRDTGGRERLAALRGERFEKAQGDGEMDPAQAGGGTIYQGEWDGPRGGDLRETVARAKVAVETVEDDPAGNHGQGGLAEWFKDTYGGQAEVNAPVGKAKIIRKSDEMVVIDDDDPYTRASRQMDPRDGGAGMRLVYRGGGRENNR